MIRRKRPSYSPEYHPNGGVAWRCGEVARLFCQKRHILMQENFCFSYTSQRTPLSATRCKGTERTIRSWPFRPASGANGHHAQVIATGLDAPVEHTLQIEPVLDPGQELRLESICVAGREAAVAAAR